METQSTIKRGDRVTCDAHPNVLGTVKRANDVGDAFVEWHAHGHITLDWMDASKLTVWVPA